MWFLVQKEYTPNRSSSVSSSCLRAAIRKEREKRPA